MRGFQRGFSASVFLFPSDHVAFGNNRVGSLNLYCSVFVKTAYYWSTMRVARDGETGRIRSKSHEDLRSATVQVLDLDLCDVLVDLSDPQKCLSYIRNPRSVKLATSLDEIILQPPLRLEAILAERSLLELLSQPLVSESVGFEQIRSWTRQEPGPFPSWLPL